jgi:hypothetical protein
MIGVDEDDRGSRAGSGGCSPARRRSLPNRLIGQSLIALRPQFVGAYRTEIGDSPCRAHGTEP